MANGFPPLNPVVRNGPTPKNFWTYQSATETPADPPPGSPMTRREWEGLSPGMRREIYRDIQRSSKLDACFDAMESLQSDSARLKTRIDAVDPYRHFSGTTRLTNVAIRGPGKGQLAGINPDKPPVWNGKEWTGYVPVERSVKYKQNPSKHECDARCMNATGRNMNCECACGGKNHGAGAFKCD